MKIIIKIIVCLLLLSMIVLLIETASSDVFASSDASVSSTALTELLNKAIARELGTIVQYRWQHVMAMGMDSPRAKDIFEELSNDETTHVDEIAERLFYLGGVPTTKPIPINVGDTLGEMIELDIKAEDENIALYHEIINESLNERDSTTRLLFEKILNTEEQNKNILTKMLK